MTRTGTQLPLAHTVATRRVTTIFWPRCGAVTQPSLRLAFGDPRFILLVKGVYGVTVSRLILWWGRLMARATIVTIRPKSEITVPASIRRKAGLKAGDRLSFQVSGRVITIVPSTSSESRAERAKIERAVVASERDFQNGRAFGPFETHEEFLKSLHDEDAKLRAKRRTRPRR
jgi:AbrB family looped-hinge helix DNA binding protein